LRQLGAEVSDPHAINDLVTPTEAQPVAGRQVHRYSLTRLTARLDTRIFVRSQTCEKAVGSTLVIPVIDVHGLVKTFGRTRALDGLGLVVNEGEVHGFLGPNGAGKSTTIRVLLGMLRRRSGTATVLGQDPWRDAMTIHRDVAYVPGDVSLWPNLSGGETIDFLTRCVADPTRRCEPGCSTPSTSTPRRRAAGTRRATGRRWHWSLRSPDPRSCTSSTNRPAGSTPSWSRFSGLSRAGAERRRDGAAVQPHPE